MKRLVGFFLIYLGFAGLCWSSSITANKSDNSEPVYNNVYSDTTAENRFVKVELFNLDILDPSSGVQYYRDGIIFLSSSKSEEKMLPGQVSFGTTNTVYAVLNDTVLGDAQVFAPSSRFIYPTEACTFSSDFNTMYFTKISEADGIPKIYQGKYSTGTGNQGNWTIEGTPVSFCSGQSIYTHPALSADGKLLIFASDRAGSVGGMDLFVTQNVKGTWSTPVSLGDAVNSRANELYPYLDSENNLYFSSDGIPGYGGYDIFVCKFKGNTWENPINLSTPVNTRFDDVAFTMNRKTGGSAFYTVRQKSVVTPKKLYRVTMNGSAYTEKLTNLSQIFTNPKISHMVILAIDPPVEATDKRIETGRSRTTESRGEKENVVYRVQFLTSFNPRTRSLVNVAGKDYKVFEYLYSGAYRLCVGEFATLSPALELQNVLRKDDYPQAFVVAFKNNIPSFDPELLKVQPGLTATTEAVEKKVTSLPETPVKPATTKAEIIKETVPSAETSKSTTAKTTTSSTPKTTSSASTTTKTSSESAVKKDVITYRLQILASTVPRSKPQVTVNGKIYNTFEYFYSGGYRICIGLFSDLNSAKEFQFTLRKSGYPQAFVVAFKNNVRSTDPALFK